MCTVWSKETMTTFVSQRELPFGSFFLYNGLILRHKGERKMNNLERELRDLMDLYDKRYEKLESERQEVKNDEDVDAEMTIECLQRQCRIMRAELFKTMKNLSVLDEEEVLYGGIKNK